AAYGVALMTWQQRLAAQADAFVVPSRFAEARLRALGAPLGATWVLPHVIREFAAAPPPSRGDHALVVSRLAPEKGVRVAIEACRLAGVPLIIAGDGPEQERLAAVADGSVRFVGRVSAQELARLRSAARVALVPSLSAETFGLAAAEAMAAGLPVAASRVGALPELVPEPWLAPPGDAQALADVVQHLRPDDRDGAMALERVRAVTAPERVAPALAAVYERAMAAR
ncbi:MAG: glycosyltransferase, partial [Solirubrobacteraceae bacterium]